MKGTRMKLIRMIMCVMALSASISVAQTPPSPGSSSTPAPPAASPPSDPIAPAGHWNVAQARCRALLGESDDDRAAIGMFYYGYLAAKLNFTVVDTSRIEGDLRHVFETCRDHPDMSIADAFRTLRSRRQ
jgi:hypothetical protein